MEADIVANLAFPEVWAEMGLDIKPLKDTHVGTDVLDIA